MSYLLDTNIIIHFLKGNTEIREKIHKVLLEGKEIFINAISYYEVKRGLLPKSSAGKLARFEELCSKSGLALLDTLDILDTAAGIYLDLRQRGKLINDADILIASIAITKNLTLVTDDADFKRIKGLEIENWPS
jgi:tRNA(fMet)-specific endonuclease VapC